VTYHKHSGHELPYPYQEPNKVYMNTCTLPDSEDLKDSVLQFELGVLRQNVASQRLCHLT
jgi:hypothetical protein